jgi:hypothetical protein
MEDNKKLGQSPAFASGNHNPEYSNGIPNGMNIRFYAACAAMQGLLSNPNWSGNQTHSVSEIIEKSYEYADELLMQENL